MNKKNLVFMGSKKNRKTSYSIYTNGFIEIKGSITKPGLRLSNRISKWIILPESKNDAQIKVRANFTLSFHNNKTITRRTVMTIFSNNYGVYILPSKEKEKQFFKVKELVRCSFQIKTKYMTKHYIEASGLIKKTKFTNLKGKECLLSGGEGHTSFEIFKIQEQIYIKHKGKIDRYGRFLLSSELRRYFENWFKIDCFVVMYQDIRIVVKAKTQKRVSSNKITKVLQFQHYGDPKNLEIMLVSYYLKLNKRTLKDLKIKEKLVKAGFNISVLNSHFRIEDKHKDILFEKRVKRLIANCFGKQENSWFLSEVKIKPIVKPNDIYQEHMCIDIAIPIVEEDFRKTELLLVEIKTGESKGKIIKEVEYDLARLLYLKSKISKQNIIPIAFFNSDIIKNSIITTKQFGAYAQVILIGLSEFELLEKKPSLFLDRIKEFKNESRFQKRSDFFENPNIEIIGLRKSNHLGTELESYVGNILRNEGHQVFSNVLIRCCGKDFEIDHLAVKDKKVSIVSCKDNSNWKSTSINEVLKKYLITLLFRKNLFGLDNARLYLKTNKELIVKEVKTYS